MYYVYILTNWTNTVIYVGVTDNLERRHWEHAMKVVPGFTSKYNVNKLVYYEKFNTAISASAREKQLKRWRREKKNRLVETMNPNWKDLARLERKGPSASLGIKRK